MTKKRLFASGASTFNSAKITKVNKGNSSKVTGEELAVGGQAVIEGVLMRGKTSYNVSVRNSSGKIVNKCVKIKQLEGFAKIIRKVPFIRGVYALVDSMKIGYGALDYSANIFADEESENNSKSGKSKVKDKSPAESDSSFLGGVGGILMIIFAIAFGISIFKFIPYFGAGLISGKDSSYFTLIEGILKIIVFVLYILLVSMSTEIKRVFAYHGAEHKIIHCYEKYGNSSKLTAKNAKVFSRIHPRCGTTFLFLVIFVSIVVYTFLPNLPFWQSFGLRLLFLPVIAGISYEILRLYPRLSKWNPVKWVLFVIECPGLLLQKLTTREPDIKQLEVALHSLKKIL